MGFAASTGGFSPRRNEIFGDLTVYGDVCVEALTVGGTIYSGYCYPGYGPDEVPQVRIESGNVYADGTVIDQLGP